MRSIFASTDSRCEPGVTLLSRHHLVSHFSNRFTRFIEFTLNWRSKGFSSRQELREGGKRRKRVKTAFVWESTSSRSRISLYIQCLLQFHFVFHVAARKVTRASKISNMASRRDIVARCCANVTINVQIKKISPIYQKFYLVSVRMDVETLTRCGILRVTEFIISLAYNYIKRRRSSVKRRKVRSPFS